MSTREFAVRAMLSQFGKRDSSGGEEHEGNGMSSGEILAIVIAALTLLMAMIPLFRCSRFRRWVSSSISPFVKKVLGIILPKFAWRAVTTTESSSAAPAPHILIPHPVLIYNDYPNTHLLGTCSNTFRYSQNGATGEDERERQAEESPVPRRPERAVTYPLP
ncbi:hypothetical protein B9Z19DRAFT_1127914 [Tuber borchii]|uniref:Uncharacterized protein n=1 Tax=Tuber borchii TaxID=42251 RepID=A0A2T6ZQI8_TUBBO|nr:hypothetical protein B9Z19DRAFT_1127914 [Tuber borchii]